MGAGQGGGKPRASACAAAAFSCASVAVGTTLAAGLPLFRIHNELDLRA